MAGPWHALIQG